MYCAECGEEVASSAKFCENCGAQVDQSESTSQDSSQIDQSEPAGHDSTQSEPTSVSSGGSGAGGLEPNIAGALSYLLGFLTGLVFFLIEEEDEFVRFHAAQSMVVFGGLFVLAIVVQVFTTVLGATAGLFGWLVALVLGLIWLVISLGILVLWIFLMVRAYQGKTPRIPIAAGIADDLV